MNTLCAIFLLALVSLMSGVGHAAQGSAPVLSFDKKGRLIQVVTADGRRCVYHYAPDGRLISPLDSSCGEPEQWLKAKSGG
jgi:YD repeat-containing protein